eukprot:Gb_38521 [translate_table: standard]
MKAVALSQISMGGDSPMTPTIMNSPETPLDLRVSSAVSAEAAQVVRSGPTQESPVICHEPPEHNHQG